MSENYFIAEYRTNDDKLVEDKILLGKIRPGVCHPKKGTPMSLEAKKMFFPTIPKDAFRDRETGQLFEMVNYEGQEKEKLLSNPRIIPSKQKEISLVKTFKPILFPHAFLVCNISKTTKVNVLGSQSESTVELDIISCKVKNTVNNVDEFINCQPKWVSFTLSDVPQYCAVKKYEIFQGPQTPNTPIGKLTLVNPVFFNQKSNISSSTGQSSSAPKYKFSCNIGNFVYGSCAVFTDVTTLLVGVPFGIYVCKVDRKEKTINSILKIIPNDGLWNPLHFHYVQEDTKGGGINYLYMTASLTHLNSEYVPYVDSYPGWRFANYTVKHPSFGQSGQSLSTYIGNVVIFKFEMASPQDFNLNNYTIVYSNLKGPDPADFQKETDNFFTSFYYTNLGGRYKPPSMVDDQKQHTIKLKSVGIAATPNPTGGGTTNICTLSDPTVDFTAIMNKFNFGIDSLVYRRNLFFLKTDDCLEQVYSPTTGSLIRSILWIGHGFPLNAKRLRYAGTYVKLPKKKMPQEDLASSTIPASTLATDKQTSCYLGGCHYIKGKIVYPQIGHYMCGDDGSSFVMTTWDSLPYYTNYLFHRNFYNSTRGDNNYGYCDVVYYYNDRCGSSSYCYTEKNTFYGMRRLTTAGSSNNGASMHIGYKFPVKYLSNICCGPTYGMSNAIGMMGGGLLGVAVGLSMDNIENTYGSGPNTNGCEKTFLMSNNGYVLRKFYLKNSGSFFMDSITSSFPIFDYDVDLKDRILPKAFYDNFEMGDNRGGGYFSDYRRFVNNDGVSISYLSPKLEDSKTSNTYGLPLTDFVFTGSDTWSNRTGIDWLLYSADFRLTPKKTVSVTGREAESPMAILNFQHFSHMMLYDSEFIVYAAGNEYKLRDYMEALEDYTDKGKNGDPLDPSSPGRVLHFDTSHNMAFYPLVGLNDIFPMDRLKYKGAWNLGGKAILEGITTYDAKATPKVTRLDNASSGTKLKIQDICKNPLLRFTHDYQIYKIERDVTYKFTSKKEAMRISDAPDMALEGDDPTKQTSGYYSLKGKITEYYLLVQFA